jgi:hypothetical protein
VVAFGAFCFGCGYLTAFIVTRNQWRDEMIKRGVARYNWQTGARCKSSFSGITMPARRFPPPWTVEESDGYFIVRDHNGLQLTYYVFRGGAGKFGSR